MCVRVVLVASYDQCPAGRVEDVQEECYANSFVDLWFTSSVDIICQYVCILYLFQFTQFSVAGDR